MFYSVGCNLYGLSRPGSCHLRMVVSIGRRLLLFTWKHSAEWLAWCCPTMEMDAVEGFTLVRVSNDNRLQQFFKNRHATRVVFCV